MKSIKGLTQIQNQSNKTIIRQGGYNYDEYKTC